LMTGRRTAIGSAILKSIDAIAEIDLNVLQAQGAHDDNKITPVPKEPMSQTLSSY
jgi:hypothetical protein